MMRYDAILIDADDTLLDFKAAEQNALSRLLRALDLDTEAARRTYHAVNDACWRALERGEMDQARLKVKRFEDFLARMGRRDDPASVSERYTDLLSREGGLLKGALECTRAIAARRPVAIVTNGIARIQHGRLAASGLMPYVSALVISEELGVAKPDPRMIFEALELLGGIAPGRALMVGDSLSSDIACARAAGVDACWLNRAGAKAPEGLPIAHEIADISQLKRIALSEGDP